MAFVPLHRHILVKAIVNTPITSVKDGKKLLTDLVELVGMVPVTKPQAVYVHDEGNKGLTGSINLATSHIAFHVWDETGLLMLDLYSCKSFEDNIVLDHIVKVFGGVKQIESITLNRDNFQPIDWTARGSIDG